jgi:SAM-dependent methyltransferase
MGTAIHEGFWLGLLRDSSLDQVTADGYQRGTTFSSAEHNRRGLFSWERNAVEAHFPPQSKVVIAAAGGGREALALVAQGFQVLAFDPDERLICECRKRLAAEEMQRLTLLTTPPNAVPAIAGAAFDAGIVGWGALGHITSAEKRKKFLRAFAGLLKPGAPALISFHMRPSASLSDGLRCAIARAIAAITFGRRPEEGDRLRIENDASFLHLFTAEEAKAEIESGGFTVAHFAELPEAHVVAIKNRS